jgi:hypothetical protein
VVAFLRATGSDRHRVGPVLLAFLVYVGSLFLINSSTVTNAAAITAVDGISLLAMLALGVAVVHGVVRHRVIAFRSFLVERSFTRFWVRSLLAYLR